MNRRSIKVVCFAGLRKYFGSEIVVTIDMGISYSGVIDSLKALNPESAEVLSSCRIAVKEEFVSLSEPLKPENTIFLIPPSSGG